MMKAYHQEQTITLYQGDCLEVMAALEPGSVDAVICDPPYGTTACAWDTVIPFAPMWEALRRLVRPRAPIVLFGSQPFTSALVMSNPKDFRYSWVWEKDVGTGFLDANRKPLKCHEDIVVFADGQTTYNPQKVKGRPNHSHKHGHAWEVSAVYGVVRERTPPDQSGMKYPRSVVRFAKYSAAEDLHPTQKPLELMSYLVATYTNPGDTVLDFTVGSGTTLRAAKNLGRKAIGIEIDEGYCSIAANRLSQEVLDLSLPSTRPAREAEQAKKALP
jgi:hypothetical protein